MAIRRPVVIYVRAAQAVSANIEYWHCMESLGGCEIWPMTFMNSWITSNIFSGVAYEMFNVKIKHEYVNKFHLLDRSHSLF